VGDIQDADNRGPQKVRMSQQQVSSAKMCPGRSNAW
jgi:hypothetical protein